MAKKETWEAIKSYFNSSEFGMDAYEKMEDDFLLSLYRFRVAVNSPIIIHVGYELTGHATNSFHYKGRAVDFHFVRWIDFRRVILAATNSGLYGVGYYTWWHPVPGFHLDNRSPSVFNIWKSPERGKYLYLLGDK